MENKYSCDISNFGKFVLLKYLFNDKNIGFVWYLTPDENSQDYTDKYKVFEKNKTIYEYASLIDKNMAQQFNIICKKKPVKFHVSQIEQLELLNNVTFYNKGIIGVYPDGRDYRKEWLLEALDKIKDCDIVYLDSDYGLPVDYRIFVLKSVHQLTSPYKYLSIEEIKEFLLGKDVLIFHNIYPVGIEHNKVHSFFFKRLKKEFHRKYFYILRQNPFSPRFFFVISRYDLTERLKKFLIEKRLCTVNIFKGFFTLFIPDNTF